MFINVDCQYCKFGNVYGGDLVCSKTQETITDKPSECALFNPCDWIMEEIKKYKEELKESSNN